LCWRLSDEETAQRLSFVRQGWGNHSAEVSVSQVAKVRKAIRDDGGKEPDQANTAPH
jgi:hypothetical protein